jgi:hypothetical protein
MSTMSQPAASPSTSAPALPPAPSTPAVAAQEPAAKSEPPWGAIVVMAGLTAIVAVFVVAVLHYKAASDVATAVGAVSGVIAALVGAYFGIRGAILAQGNAEQGPSNTKV